MKTFLTLDYTGVALAIALGAFILYFGRGMGGFFVFIILLFLFISYIATNVGKRKKILLGLYEKRRDWKNVIANGAVPAIIALVYFADTYIAFMPLKVVVAAYVASVAAIAADKFASELGVLDGTPRMIFGFREVSKGTSGAVTLLGLGSGLFAAMLIGIWGFVVGLGAAAFEVVVFSAFVGNLVDSVFGYFEEKGIGDKFTSNALCSLAAAMLCVALLGI